jgi:acyl-CoA hydrolase
MYIPLYLLRVMVQQCAKGKSMPRETIISHLIKPEDLQHHGTLFAGQMAKWLVEACFVSASRLVGKPKDIVCVQVHGISFNKPAQNGDILEIKSRVAYTGTTSVTVYGEAFINESKTPAVHGMATFVTVDKDNIPYKHDTSLSEDYIAQNREIHEEAVRVRTTK